MSPVNTPEQYSVIELNASGRALSTEEHPTQPRSNNVAGLYFSDNDVLDVFARILPYSRGKREVAQRRSSLSGAWRSARLIGRDMASSTPGCFRACRTSYFAQILERVRGCACLLRGDCAAPGLNLTGKLDGDIRHDVQFALESILPRWSVHPEFATQTLRTKTRVGRPFCFDREFVRTNRGNRFDLQT